MSPSCDTEWSDRSCSAWCLKELVHLHTMTTSNVAIMCLGIKWFCALAICNHQMLTLKPLRMRLGTICNRRMPTLNMMLCGALAPTQPLTWTSVKMMWSCTLSQSSQLARDAVINAMICAPALINVMMISYACDYNCQILWCNQMLVIAIVDFVLRHKSICNELWFVLWRKLMLWCNQMLVIAIVDFVLRHKSIWKWMMRSFACDQLYER